MMRENDEIYDETNQSKASMDHIYDQSDPRAYFRELKPLGYCIPGWAKPVFRTLIDRLRRQRNRPLRVADIGCSYGINAALLKYDLEMADLYDHWTQERLGTASPADVIAYDRRFFGSLDMDRDLEVIGIDQAANAVRYGETVGLLDRGFSVNLEDQSPSGDVRDALAPVDLVTSTGCVGYVSERTFEHLTEPQAPERQPWIANFVLRMFPFDAIAHALAERGYVTEKLAGRTFVQRRFASAAEETELRARLEDLGIDPTPETESGCLLAELYVSRPERDAREIPLETLLAA